MMSKTLPTMIISSHLCLLTDGLLGRFPVVRTNGAGEIISFDILDGDFEEIGGMIFRGGVMVCGVPGDFVGITAVGKEDFVRQLSPFALCEHAANIAVLSGGDLQSLSGSFSAWRPKL